MKHVPFFDKSGSTFYLFGKRRKVSWLVIMLCLLLLSLAIMLVGPEVGSWLLVLSLMVVLYSQHRQLRVIEYRLQRLEELLVKSSPKRSESRPPLDPVERLLDDFFVDKTTKH